MIIRIVRMTFHEDKVADFQQIFAQMQQFIQNFEGCQHLELWQDADNPCIFMTYSFWENTEALERYRQSEFFRTTWAKVKPLFSAKPLAFSALEVV